MDLREVDHGIDQYTHWYYFTKCIPLIRFVENVINTQQTCYSIIDIGAGTGYFSRILDQKFGNRIAKIILVDINYSDSEVEFTKGQRIEKTKKLPEQITESIVVMMDVLEHMEYDKLFMKELATKTTGTNYFFVTVPAFMSLWSNHDRYLLHFRRYTSNSISELVNEAGIEIKSRYYLYFALLPFAWIIRKIIHKNKKDGNDLRQPNKFSNSILKYFFLFEMRFIKYNRIWGTSCCVEGVSNKSVDSSVK